MICLLWNSCCSFLFLRMLPLVSSGSVQLLRNTDKHGKRKMQIKQFLLLVRACCWNSKSNGGLCGRTRKIRTIKLQVHIKFLFFFEVYKVQQHVPDGLQDFYSFLLRVSILVYLPCFSCRNKCENGKYVKYSCRKAHNLKRYKKNQFFPKFKHLRSKCTKQRKTKHARG